MPEKRKIMRLPYTGSYYFILSTYSNMKRLFALLLVAFIVLLPSIVQAQADTVNSIADSVVNRLLQQTAQELKQSKQKHMIDSLQKVNLEKELALLKASESTKRDELQERIIQIQKGDSIRKEAQKQKIQELKSITKGFPVAPFGDTLLYVFTRIGSFSPQERAARINDRIQKLYTAPGFDAALFHLLEGEGAVDIVYDDVVLMTLTEMDALWQDISAKDLSVLYLDEISHAVVFERDENSLKNILFRILEVVLVILGVWLLISLLNRLFNYSRRFIETRLTRKFKAVKVQNYELLSDGRIIQGVLWLHSVLRVLVIGLSLYLTLPLIFSIFPTTEAWADLLIGWIVTPVKNILIGVLDYLPNLFTIAVVYLAIRYLIKFIRFMADEIEQGKLVISGFHREWTQPTFNIIRFLLYIFMFIVIFPYLPGSQSPVFQGVSVFLGILFSLGSSSAISNAVAGLVITYMRPFKVGDRVKISEITGDVVEKTLLVTRIRTTKNEEITIPNSAILSGHTINYTTTSNELGLIVYTTVTIGYDVPWKEVHKALTDAALRMDLVLKAPAPFVLQTSLDDFYVSYQLNAYIKEVNKQARVYSELHQNIQDIFNERGIEILSPHYRAMRDGNMITIPASYLQSGYQVPQSPLKNE